MRNYYVSGDWNALCQRCGFKYKASQLREEWTGVKVCASCYETRHPQTLIRVPEDDPSVPWSSPEPIDSFISVSSPLTTEDGDSTDFWILAETGLFLATES